MKGLVLGVRVEVEEERRGEGRVRQGYPREVCVLRE